MTETFDFTEGEVLLIDKPLTWTSFDVVKKVRGTIRVKKVGHAGTLDPLATGLLILCTGKKTKKISQFQDQEKEYTGTLVIGKTTPSIDLETDFDTETDFSQVQPEEVQEAAAALTGYLQQTPPMHSAIQVDGERLYKVARRGEVKEIKKRDVYVSEFELTRIALPEVDFRIVCTKGTYIRSLVRDLGEAVGVGAYLAALRRTRIGDFHVDAAWDLETFIEKVKAERNGDS